MSRGLPRGTIKLKPEDFVVDEIPAYEPSGEGSHLYVRIEKTNRTTDEVVKELARALRVDRRDIGVAGLKDKVGVTRQWLSVPAADASFDDRVAALAIDGVAILERRRHGNKLKTGHLRGNRFAIVVRDIDPARVDDVVSALARIGEAGVPNAFGEQRFGRDGDTHERARAWLTGKERAPSDPRLRRFHFSALQSAIFNAVLEHRVADGSWDVPILGDLLKKEESGGIFVCTDVQLDRERARQGEVCPTGPIVGDRMRQPEADAFDLEQRISLPLIEGIDLRRARSLGEGTRRPLRLRVAELSHSFLDSSLHEAASSQDPADRHAVCAMTVRFVLPKGAYATTVLSNAFEVSDAGRTGGPSEPAGDRPDEREERQLATLTEEE
ncbi:MAG: tRNA pseudouridine(13) synthase TruD [Labilithrix sp.]|nr:tRNA pseudouridine(13) synthase TruD [Labilithrix sp.]